MDGSRNIRDPTKLTHRVIIQRGKLNFPRCMLETQAMAHTLITRNIICALVLHSGSSSNSHRVWNKVSVSNSKRQKHGNNSPALDWRWMELKTKLGEVGYSLLSLAARWGFTSFNLLNLTEQLDCLRRPISSLCFQYRDRWKSSNNSFTCYVWSKSNPPVEQHTD